MAGVVCSLLGALPRCSDSSVENKNCCRLPSLHDDHLYSVILKFNHRNYIFGKTRKTFLLPCLLICSINTFLGTNAGKANHILSLGASWRPFTAQVVNQWEHGVDCTWQLFGLSVIKSLVVMLLCKPHQLQRQFQEI